MQTLLITANPSTKSLTYKNAEIVENKLKQHNFEITRIEAYDIPLYGSSELDNTRIETIRNKILIADYIFIFAPLWNFGLPGGLKNFFDVVIKPKIHFAYTKIGVPRGFLKTKKVFIIYTSGTDNWLLKTMPLLSVFVWNIKLIFMVCGVKRFKVYHLGGPKNGGSVKKEKLENWFKKLENII